MLHESPVLLSDLAERSQADFNNRVHLRLQFAARGRDILRHINLARGLILEMPEIIENLRKGAHDPSLPPRERLQIQMRCRQMDRELNDIPVHTPGLFGYLEKAFFTARVLELTMEECPTFEKWYEAKRSDIKTDLLNWVRTGRKILQSETHRTDEWIQSRKATHSSWPDSDQWKKSTLEGGNTTSTSFPVPSWSPSPMIQPAA